MDIDPAGCPAGTPSIPDSPAPESPFPESPFPDNTAGTDGSAPLRGVAQWLRCPHCAAVTAAAPLSVSGRTLMCSSAHRFDIARHGHVSMLHGRRRHHGDDPAMVAARERFLGRDHYRPLRSTITALVAEHAPPRTRLVADLAGGTGHYLSPVLDALPNAHGLVVDASTSSLRRAARAHPRAAALGADLVGQLPLADGVVDVALSVFGPRPAREIDRVLRADGIVVVATARTGHLSELRSRLGLLGIDPRKAERLREGFTAFDVIDEQSVGWRLALDHHEVEDLVAMGPSARHLDPAGLQEAIGRLPDVVAVTAAMSATVLRRCR